MAEGGGGERGVLGMGGGLLVPKVLLTENGLSSGVVDWGHESRLSQLNELPSYLRRKKRAVNSRFVNNMRSDPTSIKRSSGEGLANLTP